MAEGLIDFQAFFELINYARLLIVTASGVVGLYLIYSLVTALIKMGQTLQYAGMASLVSSEYTVSFIIKRFFFAVLLLNFTSTFLLISEDVIGQAYPLGLVQTSTDSSGQVMMAKLVFDLFETYGWFNLVKAFWDAAKNNTPLYQQGKNPWSGIIVRILGSLGLIFMPMIIDGLWEYTSLNVLGLLVDLIEKM